MVVKESGYFFGTADDLGQERDSAPVQGEGPEDGCRLITECGNPAQPSCSWAIQGVAKLDYQCPA